MVEPSSAAQAPTELRADLRLAFDVAELAAELALAHFTSGVSVTLKADGSPVTAADREVEHLLRQTLSHARPHDSFLGEEFGRVGDSDRIWILDPIDGTGFFSRGDPNQCGDANWGYRHIKDRHYAEFQALASPARLNWSDLVHWVIYYTAADPDHTRVSGSTTCRDRMLYLHDSNGRVVMQKRFKMIYNTGDGRVITTYPTDAVC